MTDDIYRKMRILHLHVKRKYFDQIKSGEKTEEYRRFNFYWLARIDMRDYDEIHIMSGYPKKGDKDSTLVLPWRGYSMKTITHDEFGPEPVTVYAIRLENDS